MLQVMIVYRPPAPLRKALGAGGNFDESKHPRDHGRFSHVAGAQGTSPAARRAPETDAAAAAAARAHAASSEVGNLDDSERHRRAADEHTIAADHLRSKGETLAASAHSSLASHHQRRHESVAGDGGPASPWASPADQQRADQLRAYGHLQDKFLASASPAERRAVMAYTSGFGFTGINESLRAGTEMPADLKESVHHIDNMMDRAALPDAMTVYRGVQNKAGLAHYDKFKEGDEFTDLGFVSTSADPKYVNDSQDKVKIVMKLPKGQRAIPAFGSGDTEHEKEVLVDRGTSFRVVGRAQREVGTPERPKQQLVLTVEAVPKAANKPVPMSTSAPAAPAPTKPAPAKVMPTPAKPTVKPTVKPPRPIARRPTPPTPKPPVAAKKPASLVGADNKTFGAAVQDAADRAPRSHGFGDDEVFQNRIYETLKPQLGAMTLDEFKRKTNILNREQHINMSRADLVGAMERHDVAQSAYQDQFGTLHFVHRSKPAPAEQADHQSEHPTSLPPIKKPPAPRTRAKKPASARPAAAPKASAPRPVKPAAKKPAAPRKPAAAKRPAAKKPAAATSRKPVAAKKPRAASAKKPPAKRTASTAKPAAKKPAPARTKKPAAKKPTGKVPKPSPSRARTRKPAAAKTPTKKPRATKAKSKP